jgi:RNA polymerase sigma-70 factor (ECF subfamily)
MDDFEWIPRESFGNARFKTEWPTVDQARQGGPDSAEAIEKLCRTYWYPLYAYVRGRGYDQHEAQDLTQEFFARLLAKPWLENVHPSKGRFRAFLLAAMNHFLVHDWRRETAAKRGGGREVFSLDALAAEQRYHLEPSHHESPDHLFDRSWAVTVSKQAVARLQSEYSTPAKSAQFDALKHSLLGGGVVNPEPPAEIARRLNLAPDALRKILQRLRQRHLEMIREEITRTVINPDDVEEEYRQVLSFLGR